MDTKIALKFAKDISADDVRAFARAVMAAYDDATNSHDFFAKTDMGEFRFIHESKIEIIHREEISILLP